MIISASRRTDIPALYSEWFINRLKEGSLLVRNPMNRNQVSRIILSPEMVDCIVFWSKNPQPILKYLNFFDKYNYYFLFTITPYDSSIEINLTDKKEVIETFKRLSDSIGPERVIWRYDPVFYTDKYDYSFHLKNFEKLTGELSGYTEKCIYSFLTVYKKCERNMKHISFSRPEENDIIKLSQSFSEITASNNIQLQTCAENIDLTRFGISRGKCIDEELISRISGRKLSVSKDRNQRDACLCAASIDIGAYNTCTHRCIYCYANHDHNHAIYNFKEHNPDSELLTDNLTGDETIKERQEHSKYEKQLKLF